ncbi:MAG: protein translocase subunit SecD [Actinobacteria bacterium]|nr:protein translocase subunit SecD [Actinomycetota bacterium]
MAVGSLSDENASFTPKLALDLQGGTQVILSPLLLDGQAVTPEQLDQAVSIIRQRVDASGVSESQVVTQGDRNIVVSIPGVPDENTLALIKASAKLEFRAVLVTSVGAPSSSVDGTDPAAEGTTTDGEAPAEEPAPEEQAPSVPNATPTDPSDLNWVSPELQAEFDALDCATPFREPGQVDDPTVPLITCDVTGTQKFILGPVEVEGANIADASNGTVQSQTGASTNTWAVNLDFDAAGTQAFADVTQRLFPLAAPRNQFAITLDGFVITAPATQAVITGGSAQITGNFDRDSSKVLADQLKYGSLPIGFEVESQENISASLGSEQLQNGVLAALIGLVLVLAYSVFQYRGLAVITLGSLIVAGILVYLIIAFLSWRQGYRLSLAGVTGLIVSIGVTVDSFIVFFERVRDEIREGRSLETAVENGWKRGIRTIIASNTVSFTAAVSLFLLTVGNVRGFAFTLGLTTLVNLIVVALFTYPFLRLLARAKFFSSGHPWSGFDSKQLKASGYVGRGQFRKADTLAAGKIEKSSGEAERRQTIAERKAMAAIAEAEKKGDK